VQKWLEMIEKPFVVMNQVGPGNSVLDGDPDPATVRQILGKWGGGV